MQNTERCRFLNLVRGAHTKPTGPDLKPVPKMRSMKAMKQPGQTPTLSLLQMPKRMESKHV
jgi:hypothetical protein